MTNLHARAPASSYLQSFNFNFNIRLVAFRFYARKSRTKKDSQPQTQDPRPTQMEVVLQQSVQQRSHPSRQILITTMVVQQGKRCWSLPWTLLLLLSSNMFVSGWVAQPTQLIEPSCCRSPRSRPLTLPRATLLSCMVLRATKEESDDALSRQSSYDLGLGKNKPFPSEPEDETVAPPQSPQDPIQNWMAPEPVDKRVNVEPEIITSAKKVSDKTTKANMLGQGEIVSPDPPKRTRRMVARDNDSQLLRGAMWDEQHYGTDENGELEESYNRMEDPRKEPRRGSRNGAPVRPLAFYPDIDLSIPDSVYSQDGTVDLVWDLLRWDAYQEAQREPLLVSFLYSTILNHPSLESSLAFLLANRLQSPAMMISTQLQSIILDALSNSRVFRRSLRADMMAVRDRDPACNYLPDVFLYFKGFHALQSHRVANYLWNSDKILLAQFLQSQVSQIFQIDIHPNATMSSGIMLDHGTGIVIGETATVGHNCSILHHVTLGGSGKKGVKRHPSVGNGVLLGAGATVLGDVTIGDGSQIGAGTLCISDLPSHCVAVGVPARIIGSFVDVTEQPSIGMNQIIADSKKIVTFESDGI